MGTNCTNTICENTNKRCANTNTNYSILGRVSGAELTRKEGRTKDEMKDKKINAQIQIQTVQMQIQITIVQMPLQIQITADQGGGYLEPN